MNLEICIDCQQSLSACVEGGADRIELCAGLVEGGLTPSGGFLKEARRQFTGQIMMMIRPRGGDFLYAPGELDAMCEDIRIARGEGADGVVFGCLAADGSVDRPAVDRLCAAADGLSMTFHRAFDVSRDLRESLGVLIDAGFDRVLTSGGQPTVGEGVDRLAELVHEAAGRIGILPGGGLNPEEIPDVVRRTGVTEVHLAVLESMASPMNHRRPDIPMGACAVPGEYERMVAAVDGVRAAKAALSTLS